MSHRITDADKRRMRDFARTPKYARQPEMLVPDGYEEGEDEHGD